MSTDTGSQTHIDWEDIILRLTAFTRSWVRGKSWFRGEKTTTFLMGKEVEDYVFAAIGRFLEQPEKFDPAKGELLEYLEYNLLRSFIANDLRKKENNQTDDIFADDDEDDDDDSSSSYSERVLPYTEALFPDDIDYNAIKEYIEKEVQGDTDAENIFLGIYTYGMKRREVIEEFTMTAVAFDNAMRRLNTVINRTANHFNKNNQTV
ncbi:MAG: hypothetical protein WKG06_12965 [Segetibacter sp.]